MTLKWENIPELALCMYYQISEQSKKVGRFWTMQADIPQEPGRSLQPALQQSLEPALYTDISINKLDLRQPPDHPPFQHMCLSQVFVGPGWSLAFASWSKLQHIAYQVLLFSTD